ncbi:hypothetical protein SAMN05877753_103278 [Bacillus oleivorans]|uniref:Uncharacterized protein n=1 Tax=Bacillus oleivorans TaxID=1448271 RepID=A0A285CQP1_9BACI|nr:hypothetical protein SAMN05877753_103278 [Bacillus oleivorans]
MDMPLLLFRRKGAVRKSSTLRCLGEDLDLFYFNPSLSALIPLFERLHVYEYKKEAPYLLTFPLESYVNFEHFG